MTRGPLPRLAALALVLALGPPLGAPPAAAQVPELPIPGGAVPGGSANVSVAMELQDPGEPLIPTRPYSLTLVVRYQYGQGGTMPPQGRDPGQACGTVSVPEPPPWAAVRIIPEQLCFPILPNQAVSGTTASNQTIVEINVTQDAPALEPYNFTVAFDSPPQGTIQAGHGEVSRVIMPGFVGRLRFDLPPRVAVRGGAPQEVPVTVHNLGNGPVLVRLANATAPQGLRVTLPEAFVIEQPNGTAVVHLVMEAPWTAPVRGQVAFQAESSHAARTELQGDTPRARLDVEGKAAVPGPEPALLLLAALALAGLRRRGR